MLHILYLISCFGHGRGGHFYSLRTTAQEMSRDHAVSIASVGPSASPVCANMDYYTHFKSVLPGPGTVGRLTRLVRQRQVSVIHSFDCTAYMFARIVSSVTGTPVLHTKCGGPPPRRYYPGGMGDLVLFSGEDMRFFQSSRRHRFTRLHLIPNRASACLPDQAAISDLKKRLRPRAKILLRIARFSESHKKSILDTVELVRRLNRDGVVAQLLLVGVAQHSEVVDAVKAIAGDDVVIATDERFTVNAARLIDIADAVVVTGRGAMEAALQGKLLLAPVSTYMIPALLRQENMESFAERNFSPRVKLDGTTEEREYGNILKVIASKKESARLQSYLAQYADRHFNIARVRTRYHELYLNARRCRSSLMDTGMNYLVCMRRCTIGV